MDCSLPGSSVHGILQARILEWVPVPFSGGLPNPGIEPRSPTFQADSLPAESPGNPKNTGMVSLSLLLWLFPTQELNWGLLHCFPGGSEGKVSACDAGNPGSIPGLGRFPGEGNGNPLQYSCLENPWMEEPGRLQSMWSQRVGHRLSDFTFPFLLHCRQILHQLSYEGNTYFTPAPSLFPLVTTSLVFVSMSLFCFA